MFIAKKKGIRTTLMLFCWRGISRLKYRETAEKMLNWRVLKARVSLL